MSFDPTHHHRRFTFPATYALTSAKSALAATKMLGKRTDGTLLGPAENGHSLHADASNLDA